MRGICEGDYVVIVETCPVPSLWGAVGLVVSAPISAKDNTFPFPLQVCFNPSGLVLPFCADDVRKLDPAVEEEAVQIAAWKLVGNPLLHA